MGTCRILFFFLFIGGFSQTASSISYEEAKQAAVLLGIINSNENRGQCQTCHAMQDTQTLKYWGYQLEQIYYNCLSPDNSPENKISCLKDPSGEYSAEHLGLYSAAARLPLLKSLFTATYGANSIEYRDFLAKVSMPRGGIPGFTETDWRLIQSWALAGLPYLDEFVDPYEGETQCEPQLSSQLADYIDYRRFSSWSSRHQEQSLRSLGCAFQNPADCFIAFSGKPLFPTFPEPESPVSMQGPSYLLYEFEDDMHFWIRSSADGRFVAHGGPQSYIIDLQSLLQGQTARKIKVKAYFDPAFFPDNEVFMFQGFKTGICSQSLLEDPTTIEIDFTEEECSYGDEVNTPLYQAVGTSLNKDQYWAVTGDYEEDIGGFRLSHSSKAAVTLHPYLFDGLKWKIGQGTTFVKPWEIDWIVSPSTGLLMSRKEGYQEGSELRLGYRIYKINHQTDPLTLEAMGQFCHSGLKGNISFDERFFVTYSYVYENQYAELGFSSPDDSDFQALLHQKSSIIYVTDLYHMQTYRLNDPKPNHLFLFPHFRADGWIYFLYQNLDIGRKYLVTNGFVPSFP